MYTKQFYCVQLATHLYGSHIMKDKVDMPSRKSKKGYCQGDQHQPTCDLHTVYKSQH